MVIDASVAFKLVVEEPGSDAALRLFEREEIAVPTLVHAEVANALWKRVIRGELVDDGEVESRLADLSRCVRTIDDTALIPRALRLALDLGHPVYDCVYLALAESRDEELVTADDRFARAIAATAHGARVRELGA